MKKLILILIIIFLSKYVYSNNLFETSAYNIEFKSRNSNSNINAELDLASMNLKIFGVSVIPISQIRNVYVCASGEYVAHPPRGAL